MYERLKKNSSKINTGIPSPCFQNGGEGTLDREQWKLGLKHMPCKAFFHGVKPVMTRVQCTLSTLFFVKHGSKRFREYE